MLPSQRVKLFQVFPYVAGWCLFLDSCCLCWICIDWKIRSYSACYFPLMYINNCTLDYAVLNVHAVTTSLFLSVHRHIYIWPWSILVLFFSNLWLMLDENMRSWLSLFYDLFFLISSEALPYVKPFQLPTRIPRELILSEIQTMLLRVSVNTFFFSKLHGRCLFSRLHYLHVSVGGLDLSVTDELLK